MFWQIGHDDGMEFNIASRQTKDILRGAPKLPALVQCLHVGRRAGDRDASPKLAGDKATAERFRAKAAELKNRIQSRLWDPKREFFFPMLRNDEEDKDGNKMKARTLTYQSGKFAGSPHGRELIGYVPWQFNLPDPGYEAAWKFLMDPDYFYAPFGPTTVERHDPHVPAPEIVLLVERPVLALCHHADAQGAWPTCCRTTNKGMSPGPTTSGCCASIALTHRKDGKPYLAEAAHPDTGSFEGHDGYNHSEHYFHSGFNDLIITGLVGVKPRADDVLEIDPLAPADWPWFALDDLPYHGSPVSIVWDKDGTRYQRARVCRSW